MCNDLTGKRRPEALTVPGTPLHRACHQYSWIRASNFFTVAEISLFDVVRTVAHCKRRCLDSITALIFLLTIQRAYFHWQRYHALSSDQYSPPL